MKKTYNKNERKTIAVSRRISILLSVSILLLGFLVGSAFFARPAVSTIEKRELTPFPAFTVSGFLDGSWFSDISLWYADTFPGRESWMAMENKVKNLYGVQSEEKFYGKAGTKEEKKVQTGLPENKAMDEDIANQLMQGLYVKDGVVYSAYYFNQESADAYVDMVNRTADALEGKVQVYDILVPINGSIMLDAATLDKLGGSDMKQSMDYYYSRMNDNVHTVETYDALREHNDENLFFGTDHHWTALGAYYAYVSFCEAAGIEPKSLEEYESKTFEPFYGSYYLELQDDSLKPDSVTGYIPSSTNETTVYPGQDGVEFRLNLDHDSWQGKVFETGDAYDEYNQYLRFINGDQALIRIDNPENNDGRVAVIIKESYGDAFVPFLVDAFDEVYVIDFRKVDPNVLDFLEQVNATDLIFMNSIGMINPGMVDMYNHIIFEE